MVCKLAVIQVCLFSQAQSQSRPAGRQLRDAADAAQRPDHLLRRCTADRPTMPRRAASCGAFGSLGDARALPLTLHTARKNIFQRLRSMLELWCHSSFPLSAGSPGREALIAGSPNSIHITKLRQRILRDGVGQYTRLPQLRVIVSS